MLGGPAQSVTSQSREKKSGQFFRSREVAWPDESSPKKTQQSANDQGDQFNQKNWWFALPQPQLATAYSPKQAVLVQF
jgi:hypothetical protein